MNFIRYNDLSFKIFLNQALVNRFSLEYEEENSKLNAHFLFVTF